MKKKRYFIFLLFTFCAGSSMTMADPMVIGQSKLLPMWAREKFFPRTKYYEVIRWIDPGLVQGDFNGDGQRDVAVLVSNKANKKIGIAIVFRGDIPPLVLGAGKPFYEAGDDFQWLTGWEMVGPAADAKNKADRLALAGTVTGSVVWSGKGFLFGPAVFESGN
jgi:hypothetical protein